MPSCHDLRMISGADTRIQTHADAAARTQLSEHLQLRQRIHTDQNSLGRNRRHLLTADIITDKKDMLMVKSRRFFYRDLSQTHRIHYQPFFSDDL